MKIKILLVWQYYRLDFIEVFKQISEEFDFFFLAEISPILSTAFVDDFAKVIYWQDFENADEIINRIRPNKIIFMGTEGLLSMSLNHTALKNSINTYYLQHGIYDKTTFYVDGQKSKIIKNKSNHNFRTYLFQLFFFFKTIGINKKAVVYIIREIKSKLKGNQYEFLLNNPISYRTTDYYIAYTLENIKQILDRDKADISKVIPIGNLNLDSFFCEMENENEYDSTLLFIDTPLVEVYKPNGVVEKTTMSADEANHIYGKLNSYAKSLNLKLKIKLHPFSYNSDFYVQDKNISYLRNCDINNEIAKANIVAGFYSSLMLPIIVSKKFTLLNQGRKFSLLCDLEDTMRVKFLDVHDNFEKLTFYDINDYPKAKKMMIDNYIYAVDGRATDRLINILKA